MHGASIAIIPSLEIQRGTENKRVRQQEDRAQGDPTPASRQCERLSTGVLFAVEQLHHPRHAGGAAQAGCHRGDQHDHQSQRV